VANEDKPDDTYRATLVRAAEILGGAAALSRKLQVPMPDITRWLAGAEKPSMGIFLKVIDILIEGNRTSAERQQARADRSQSKADRSQARADRDQTRADRSQAEADRDQKDADRRQDDVGPTGQPSGTKPGPLRLVQRDDSEPASNTPDEG
jgi:hypothetical protein